MKIHFWKIKQFHCMPIIGGYKQLNKQINITIVMHIDIQFTI
jgi:hypothetical protein